MAEHQAPDQLLKDNMAPRLEDFADQLQDTRKWAGEEITASSPVKSR